MGLRCEKIRKRLAIYDVTKRHRNFFHACEKLPEMRYAFLDTQYFSYRRTFFENDRYFQKDKQ